MGSFNPSAPDTIGLEWFVHAEQLQSLDSSTRAAGMLLDSTTAETIDGLYLPHQWAGPSSGYGRLWADIYESGEEVNSEDITELVYKPNETKTSSGVTKSDFSTTSNLYQAIDETDDSGPPENTDYLVNSQYWTEDLYAGFQFDTAAIANTYRIVYVKVEMRAKGFDWSWKKPWIALDWYNGSTRLGQIAYQPLPQDYVFRTYTFGPFYYDFYNEGRWLQPEIAALDNNSARNIRARFNYACAMSRLTLKVGVVPENRVAVGLSSRVNVPPSGQQTNAPISVKTPLNVDNWAKTATGDYLVVVSRLEDPFPYGGSPVHTPKLTYLDGDVAGPLGQAVDQALSFDDASGLISSAPTAGTTKTYPLTLGTSGGATSPDSQPYHDLIAQAVSTGVIASQEMNGASAQSYRRVRAVVGAFTTPDASLLFAIKRSSDNVQIGGTGTLAVSDLASTAVATPAGTIVVSGQTVALYEVQVTLASTATLAASTDYYVEVTSSASLSSPWYVFGLDTTAAHTLTTDRSYGGTTISGVVAGSADVSLDFMMTVASVPSAPTNLVASVSAVAMPDNGDAICDPGSLEYVVVTWTATAVGANFDRYELERSSDGSTWEAVASISTEATAFFNDFETPRGVAYSYRLRVVRADGAFSDWTTSSSVTANVTAADGAVFFVSNSDPTIACGYVVADPTQRYRFPSADETVFMRLHQRDYQAAFKPSEVRGAAWEFPIMVFQSETDDPPDGRGIRAFLPLRAVGEAAIPYVCILTWNGERLFGAVQVPEGLQDEPAGLYIARVVVTQTQGDSTAVAV